MSAAGALPPVSPWRDTTHLDHIPTRAELAACPPADPDRLASHHANVAKLVTQAAWQIPAPAPDCEPFTAAERREDLLDEAEGIWTALTEGNGNTTPADLAVLGGEYRRVERALGVEGVRVRLPAPAAPAAPEVPRCARGLHSLTEANTIRTPIPERQCRACRRLPLPPAPKPKPDWPDVEPSDWN